MELPRSDVEALEGVLAKGARLCATLKQQLSPLARPEVLAAMDSVLGDLVGALCLLDPSAESLDFEAHVRGILEREHRKGVIASGIGRG